MLTDMVGYSALAQRTEALALELLEEHHQLLRDIRRHSRERIPPTEISRLAPLNRSSRREEAHSKKSEIRDPKSEFDQSLVTLAATDWGTIRST